MCKRCGFLHDGLTLPQLNVFFAAFSDEPTSSCPDRDSMAAQPSSALRRGLRFSGFVSAMAALACKLDLGTSTHEALQALCSSRLQAIVDNPAAWRDDMADVPGVLLSDVHIAFAAAPQHRRWLRQLVRLGALGTNADRERSQSPSRRAVASAADSAALQQARISKQAVRMSPAQTLQLFKALRIVPKHLTSTQLLQCYATAAFKPVSAHSAVAAATAAGTAATLQPGFIFEEFLDLLGVCAEHLGSRMLKQETNSEEGSVAFENSYSTKAKRQWVAQAAVRSCTTLSMQGLSSMRTP